MAESTLSTWVERGRGKAEGLYSEVYRLSAVNSTPVIAGGPDGNTVHRIGGRLEWWGIRPTAVRGVWRWWIRALLAGLLWEEGYTCDYERLVRLEEKLGLGSTAEAARVFLRVSSKIKSAPLRRLNKQLLKGNFRRIASNLSRICRGDRWENLDLACLHLIPRYRLLSLGSEEKYHMFIERQPIPPGSVEMSVSIRYRRGGVEAFEALYVNALRLALGLGGIGQMTSRGFGKFHRFSGGDLGLWDNKFPGKIFEEVRSRLEESGGLSDIVGWARGMCIDRGDVEAPLTPAFHPEVLLYRYVGQLARLLEPSTRGLRRAGSCRNVFDALVTSGWATVKAQWKLYEGKRLFASGRDIHTWVAGLPRSVRETGYFLKGGEELGRWQSPIRITPYLRGGRWGAAVYGFLTRDLWRAVEDEDLVHCSGSRRRGRRCVPVRDILEEDLEETFRDAFEKVVGIISWGGGRGW